MLFQGASAQEGDQESKPDQYVKIRVLPERNIVKPGDEILIGIEQSIYPQWHTYWRNPGDSGAEPRVEWDMPDGFAIGNIHWPTPHKIPYGPLMNFGYSDNAILLQKLTIPETLPDGPITLTATVEILVCKDICIPESGEYTITLNDKSIPPEDNSAYLAAAQAHLPVPVPWHASYEVDGQDVVLKVQSDNISFDSIKPEGFEFFPLEWGLIDNPTPSKTTLYQNEIVMAQGRGERSLNEIKATEIILAFTNSENQRQAVSFIASHTTSTQGTGFIGAKNLKPVASTSITKALLFALLGGLILNLMPCVFPVLSIKALSLAKSAEKDPGHAKLSGLAYTAGVMLSFIAIAAALIGLKSAGAGIGWGFQLQDPLVVAALAYLLFIIGLNLTGVFEIRGHFGNFGDKLTQGDGLAGSFFTGVLATLVATPCTAPFMAAAIGYALIQPAYVSLSIFAALGLGLALPYLALSFVPALQQILPKPGAWMNIFRQFLAFPMFASAMWLVWVLSQQTDSMGLLHILIGLVMLAFGFWLLNHSPKKKSARSLVQILAALTFLSAVFLLPFNSKENETPRIESLSLGETYSPEKLASVLLTDDPVFVEMTAAWCITCKVNHAVAIDIDSTRKLFTDKNIHYLVGDWTNYDEEITDFLNSYGRNGVPIYVYYGPRDIVTGKRTAPKLLPQVLTPSIVERELNKL
ncbi:MAG: thio:disulfide interchange protein [Micavibrio sp.]|nr:MAG: thio:disulfide interchange protein [Micavibrio sp.]